MDKLSYNGTLVFVGAFADQINGVVIAPMILQQRR